MWGPTKPTDTPLAIPLSSQDTQALSGCKLNSVSNSECRSGVHMRRSPRWSRGPGTGFPRVVPTTTNCPAFVGKVAAGSGAVAVVKPAADLQASGCLGCSPIRLCSWVGLTSGAGTCGSSAGSCGSGSLPADPKG